MAKKTMDRSTQVSFPLQVSPWTPSPEERVRRLRRNHTSASLQRAPARCVRPRSVNLSAEIYHKSRLVYRSESPTARGNVALDLNYVNWKERTPPVSSHSSLVFGGGAGQGRAAFGGKIRQHHSLHDFRENAATRCRCWEYEKTGSAESLQESPSAAAPTPEGLSWRRLHMSRAKLKATATTSELLSGFAMVAMVELQINDDTLVPDWLFVMFAVCTTVLVAVHIFALMISTYILPNIEAIAKLDVCEIVNESPHERMRTFIELAWVFSTVFGLFLFLVEVSILCWVKFWDTSFTAAIAATVVVIPVLVLFVLFAVHFYRSLVVHRYDTSVGNMEKLEDLKKQLDQADASPV